MLVSVHFIFCPPGVPGVNGDDLEDTQEAGDASGHIPAHSVNIEIKFACKIIENIFLTSKLPLFGGFL